MASPANAILCALIAAAFWTLIGYALARHSFRASCARCRPGDRLVGA